jgi:hypothetical protein
MAAWCSLCSFVIYFPNLVCLETRKKSGNPGRNALQKRFVGFSLSRELGCASTYNKGSMLWSQFSAIFRQKLAFFTNINVMNTIFCDFSAKNWRFSQIPMLWTQFSAIFRQKIGVFHKYQCYVHNFLRFFPIFGKNWRFHKYQCYEHNFLRFFGKKLAFFTNTNAMFTIFCDFSQFSEKNWRF